MPIPRHISVIGGTIPVSPGVYRYRDSHGKLLYIGKAISLRRRVGSYFNRSQLDKKTRELVLKISSIEIEKTSSALEALILEANLIRRFLPPYNILGKDNRSFLYLGITREPFPRPLLYRGTELIQLGYILDRLGAPIQRRDRNFLALFGPFISRTVLLRALEIIRKAIPFSTDRPPVSGRHQRPCFSYHLGLCPGVCVGAISQISYRKQINNLIKFFSGKKLAVIKTLVSEMRLASKDRNFERAALLRDRVRALSSIRDFALITSKNDWQRATSSSRSELDVLGRVEAYDISNINGTSAVGSMAVCLNGNSAPSEYRRFKIRSVKGANDVAMMAEILKRRLAPKNRARWGDPNLIVIDGGIAQVRASAQIIREYGLEIPLVGLAKGSDRKQDLLVFDRENKSWRQVCEENKQVLQLARDQAHHFAVSYHRRLRAKHFLGK